MSVSSPQFLPSTTFEQLSDSLSGDRMVDKLARASQKQKYIEYTPYSYEDIFMNYSILGTPSIYYIAETIKYVALAVFQYLGQFVAWIFSSLNCFDLSHRVQLFSLSCKEAKNEIYDRRETMRKKSSFLNMIEFAQMHLDIETYGNDFLVPCRNQYSQRAQALAGQPMIPISMVQDERVRNLTYGRKVLDFSHPHGVCNGMSNFFIYLYFKTQSYFDNPEAHLVKLAKLFQRGAMEEAMISQSLGRVQSKFWELYEKEALAYMSPNPSTMDPYNGDLRKSHIKNGIYKVCLCNLEQSKKLTGHAMVLIKLSDTQAYIFDPNHGLIRRTGNGLNAKLFSFFQKHLKLAAKGSSEKSLVVLGKFSIEKEPKRIKETTWEEIVQFLDQLSSIQSDPQRGRVYDHNFIPDRNIVIHA